MSTSLPAGYERHTRRSPVTDPWEPLYARQTDDAVQLAIEVREPHCNGRGFAHGGLISALADNAMGLSIASQAKRTQGRELTGLVTVSLSLDFLDSAHVGEALQVQPSVLKLGRTLAFAECRVLAGERLVARGNASFRMA